MKICLQCQTEYDDTKKFCRHDGSLLEAKRANERTARSGRLTCPQCGKSIEAGKKFCRHCGARRGVDAQPSAIEPKPVPLTVRQSSPDPKIEILLLAQKHYAQGEYKEAILHFERLLAQEQHNRLYQLYWLLSYIKRHGIQGHEQSIAEALPWQRLTEQEASLARELFVLAGKAYLKKGDLAAAEQHLLRTHHLSPSQEVAKLLAVAEERKEDEARRSGDYTQTLASYAKQL